MKCFFLFSFLFFNSIFVRSQSKPNLSELALQLNKFVNDTSNNFRSFIGTLKKVQGDTIYFSSLNLTGTLTTQINVNNDSCYISADIDTMVTEKEASSLMVKWKNYLKKVLPQNYKLESISIKNKWSNLIGYTFKNNKVHISVFYTTYYSYDKACIVNLLIGYD